MSISRRGFGGLLAAGALAPRRLLAGDSSHQFLFIFCRGGWDPAWAFTPELIGTQVFTDPTGSGAEAGGIAYIDSPSRPSLGQLFERYGSQCCLINGLEIRSITHDACRRIVFTGGTDAAADDWAARIGGSSAGWPLASLVVSGPSYTNLHTSSVVRVGPDGQLGKLLSGDALREAEVPATLMSDAASDHVRAYLSGRASAASTAAGRGRQASFAADQLQALEQSVLLESTAGGLDFSAGSGGYPTFFERARPALDSLAMGLSRCAVIEHLGQWDVTWDTHSGADKQGDHFAVLADDLQLILGELEVDGLSDSVTVVVFSEMGRSPQLNLTGGKDHWTYTSAMLFGAGICGGQVIGGFDEDFLGLPVDLTTGAADPGGERLTAAHLGATLLALADAPGDGVPPIAAALC
jgi:hypothetical protein